MSVKDTFGKWPGDETDAEIATALIQIGQGLPDPCPLCKRATNAARTERLEQENATLRHALHAVVAAIDHDENRVAIRDTIWMPKEYALNCTVVEFIGTVLNG